MSCLSMYIYVCYKKILTELKQNIIVCISSIYKIDAWLSNVENLFYKIIWLDTCTYLFELADKVE